MTLDGALLVRMPVDSLAPGAERDVHARVRIPAEGAEHRVARAVLAIAGDGVPQNDSLGAALDVAAAPRAVFVSTSPDQDSRFALEVLRGTLAIAVRAFYRVAPGLWRQEPGFTPASETDVPSTVTTHSSFRSERYFSPSSVMRVASRLSNVRPAQPRNAASPSSVTLQ